MATANPYANLDLTVPDDLHADVRRFTWRHREDGQQSDIDKAPFERMVDVWWSGFCIGVAEGVKETESKKTKFITGVVLNDDPDRIRTLQLVALADTGEPTILKEPGSVVRIANDFAAAGVRILVDRLNKSTAGPLWDAVDMMKDIAKSDAQ